MKFEYRQFLYFRYDMELSDWVINTLERRSKISRLKTACRNAKSKVKDALGCYSSGKLITLLKIFVQLCLDTCKVGIFYVSMLKGLMLISILMYASNHILLNRFQTVDGYNMDNFTSLDYKVMWISDYPPLPTSCPRGY